MTQPTLDELRRAWQAMRTRACLRHWPAEFDQVMADQRRAKCVAIEATAARRRLQLQPVVMGVDYAKGPDQTSYWRPPHPPTTSTHPTPNLTDRKRAAAGDTDD